MSDLSVKPLTRILLAAEQKLLHRTAKRTLQEQWLAGTTGMTTLKQKLFGNTLQEFASAEQHLQTALPKPDSPLAQRGLADQSPCRSNALQPEASAKTATSNSGMKRANCMDHFSSKKPRMHSSDENSRLATVKEFEATEKAMSVMHDTAEE